MEFSLCVISSSSPLIRSIRFLPHFDEIRLGKVQFLARAFNLLQFRLRCVVVTIIYYLLKLLFMIHFASFSFFFIVYQFDSRDSWPWHEAREHYEMMWMVSTKWFHSFWLIIQHSTYGLCMCRWKAFHFNWINHYYYLFVGKYNKALIHLWCTICERCEGFSILGSPTNKRKSFTYIKRTSIEHVLMK